MRTGRRGIALLFCVVVGGAFAVQGCGDSARGRVASARATGPKVVVTVAGGCPRSLGPAMDVRNDEDGLSGQLLPHDPEPARGLVCEYADASTTHAPLRTRLARSVRLDTADARRLASAIVNVSVEAAHGEFHCPNQEFGTVAVIAFDYGRRTVDLWYQWTGCQTLDNGYVLAFQGGNPSFYSGFQDAFDDLAPLPGR